MALSISFKLRPLPWRTLSLKPPALLKFLSLSASRVPRTVKSVNQVWAEALVLLLTSYMTLGTSCSLSVSQGKSTAGMAAVLSSWGMAGVLSSQRDGSSTEFTAGMAGVLSSQWGWQQY